MTTVSPGTAAGPVTLAEVSRRFLCRDALEASHCVHYGRTLAALTEVVGSEAGDAAVTIGLEDDLLPRCDHVREFAPGTAGEFLRGVLPVIAPRRIRCSVSSRSSGQ
jgi:hypothetical protein